MLILMANLYEALLWIYISPQITRSSTTYQVLKKYILKWETDEKFRSEIRRKKKGF